MNTDPRTTPTVTPEIGELLDAMDKAEAKRDWSRAKDGEPIIVYSKKLGREVIVSKGPQHG